MKVPINTPLGIIILFIILLIIILSTFSYFRSAPKYWRIDPNPLHTDLVILQIDTNQEKYIVKFEFGYALCVQSAFLFGTSDSIFVKNNDDKVINIINIKDIKRYSVIKNYNTSSYKCSHLEGILISQSKL